MFRKKRWGIFLLALGMTGFSLTLYGQDFSTFFIDFIRYPERQSLYVNFPLKVDNAAIRNSRSYIPVQFLTRSNIPILCADSLNAISHFPQQVVSVLQFGKEPVNNYTFEERSGSWKLMSSSSRNLQSLPDSDFLNFIIQYSQDESFQMKHTIFPFPYRTYNTAKKEKEPKNNLLMPREWESLDFTALFPSICIFHSNSDVPNRQLHIFKNGKRYLFFNFIQINKKWYLIEMEEYLS
jgi:hypothetical protein